MTILVFPDLTRFPLKKSWNFRTVSFFPPTQDFITFETILAFSDPTFEGFENLTSSRKIFPSYH